MGQSTNSHASVRWGSGINVLAGVWLLLAPHALGYVDLDQAVWNDRVVGVTIFVLALTRVGAPERFEALSWVNFVLGAWLIIAPFVLVYGGLDPAVSPASATGNDIVIGILVIAMASWSARATTGFEAESQGGIGVTPAERRGAREEPPR